MSTSVNNVVLWISANIRSVNKCINCLNCQFVGKETDILTHTNTLQFVTKPTNQHNDTSHEFLLKQMKNILRDKQFKLDVLNVYIPYQDNEAEKYLGIWPHFDYDITL